MAALSEPKSKRSSSPSTETKYTDGEGVKSPERKSRGSKFSDAFKNLADSIFGGKKAAEYEEDEDILNAIPEESGNSPAIDTAKRASPSSKHSSSDLKAATSTSKSGYKMEKSDGKGSNKDARPVLTKTNSQRERPGSARSSTHQKSNPGKGGNVEVEKRKKFSIGIRKKKKQYRKSLGPFKSSQGGGSSYGSSFRESANAWDNSEIERQVYQKTPSLLNDPNRSPKLLRRAVPPRLGDPRLKGHSSSTGSLMLMTTIQSPDVKEIVQCMATSLHWALKDYERKLHESNKMPVCNDVWNEELHPIDYNFDLFNVPTEQKIEMFLNQIFVNADLSAECGVMAMCYVDRVLSLTGMYLLPRTWRRIILGAIILASKIWEEMAVWNADFKRVFPLLEAADLGALEREYLTVLQFTVTLKASVYAKYYYELRALSSKDESHFPLKPLDGMGLKKIEERSRGLDKKNRNAGPPRLTRSVSAESYEIRPRRVILN